MGLLHHLQFLIVCLPTLIPQISMRRQKDPELNQTSHETPMVHITEYSTALINMTWVDSKGKVLHTETSETGRFSSAGPTAVSGVLAVPQSQGGGSSDSDLASFGCSAPLSYEQEKLLEAPPIALLSRGKCAFDKKVENAEAAGAVGVIIYNDKDEEKLRTIAVSNSTIPVVFTYQWKGKELLHLVEEGKTVFITMEEGSRCKQGAGNNSAFFTCVRTKNLPAVEPGYNSLGPFDEDNSMKEEDEIAQSWAVIVVSVSFFILMMLSLGILLFFYLHRVRVLRAKDDLERRACRQALKALRNVQLVVVEEIDKEKECMVCLEMMEKGDEVRCLPCGHRFHRKCIDTWMLSKRKCPLCNLNIVQHFGLMNYQDSDVESDRSDMVHGS